jgi:hypothetical protein
MPYTNNTVQQCTMHHAVSYFLALGHLKQNDSKFIKQCCDPWHCKGNLFMCM